MAGKYSWIGYALLGCHWLGWLMMAAHVDEPQTAGCQPTNWLPELTERSKAAAAARIQQSEVVLLLNRDLYTHLWLLQTHAHTILMPFAAFSIERMKIALLSFWSPLGLSYPLLIYPHFIPFHFLSSSLLAHWHRIRNKPSTCTPTHNQRQEEK